MAGWSNINFGKYEGKSLPQVVLKDPDWFFWAYEEGVLQKRGYKKEGDEVYQKATRMRIPGQGKQSLVAEYILHQPTGKFGGMQIVPAQQPQHAGSSATLRKDVIDLSMPRQIASYDKTGGTILMQSVRFVLFGKQNARLTKKRCENFFSDNDNFVL